VSIRVDDEAAVNGSITRGSSIVVYATFESPEFLPGGTPQQQITKAGTSVQTSELPTLTTTLIPAVRVLEVVNPVVAEGSSQSANEPVTLTLDLDNLTTEPQSLYRGIPDQIQLISYHGTTISVGVNGRF
jgi:Flp pilus assembly protein CpaB